MTCRACGHTGDAPTTSVTEGRFLQLFPMTNSDYGELRKMTFRQEETIKERKIPAWMGHDPVTLFACPNCGTVRVEVPHA